MRYKLPILLLMWIQEMEDEYNDSKKDMEKSLKGHSKPDNFGWISGQKTLEYEKD